MLRTLISLFAPTKNSALNIHSPSWQQVTHAAQKNVGSSPAQTVTHIKNNSERKANTSSQPLKINNPLAGKHMKSIRNNKHSHDASLSWLAYVIAVLVVSYAYLVLLSWVSYEEAFYHTMFKLPVSELSAILPNAIADSSPTRLVVAKLLSFYFSYPTLMIAGYLVYAYIVSSIHWFGSIAAKTPYQVPKHRMKNVAFFADIAPVFGVMSSFWALMNKGSESPEYIRWVMCGPSFLGMLCLAAALLFVHFFPHSKD